MCCNVLCNPCTIPTHAQQALGANPQYAATYCTTLQHNLSTHSTLCTISAHAPYACCVLRVFIYYCRVVQCVAQLREARLERVACSYSVAVCCSVLQCVAVCCSVLQCAALFLQCAAQSRDSRLECDKEYASNSCLYTLQHTATHSNTLQHTSTQSFLQRRQE